MKGYAMATQNQNPKPYLKVVEPTSKAQKATRTTLDTVLLTPTIAKGWKLPSFQRPLKVNFKVMEVMNEIRDTQVIPGVITIGVIDKVHYLLDGQHRREAFIMAEIPEAFCDIRYTHFEDEAEMADEFIKVNSHIVTLKPDDILRGLEKSNKSLAKIKREFPLVGYDNIRRGDRGAVVSMSALLRCWLGSQPEVPSMGGFTAKMVVENLTDEDVESLLKFCELARLAWGTASEHHRLWLNLNLCVCMWLYRRLVITPYSASVKKISSDTFKKCLMSVAADGSYSDYLLGRNLRERDRSPTYSKLKSIFAKRIEEEEGYKPRLPSPEWGGR